jgi:hypothetical protein
MAPTEVAMDPRAQDDLIQGGDAYSAQMRLRELQRHGETLEDPDVAYVLLLDAIEEDDPDTQREMVELLLSLEAYEEALGWFPDEVKRLEELSECSRCGGSGEEPLMPRTRPVLAYVECSECAGQERFKVDEAAEVGTLLARIFEHVDSKEQVAELYVRCLRAWYPWEWRRWFDRRGSWGVKIEGEWGNVVMVSLQEDAELEEVPSCICGGHGGCPHCYGQCPACGNEEQQEYGCLGSRNGYCRGGGCGHCNDNNVCPRCGK